MSEKGPRFVPIDIGGLSLPAMPELEGYAKTFGVELTERMGEQLRQFAAWLPLANEQVNLTGIVEPSEVALRHFADSFSLLPLVRAWGEAAGVETQTAPLRVVDVGTGCGVPGLVLGIVRPTWRVTLLDSVAKKLRMLDLAIEALGLGAGGGGAGGRSGWVRTLARRAEELGREEGQRESHDVVTARAVGPLLACVEWCHPLARRGGLILLPQGDGGAGASVDSEAVELDETTGTCIRKHFPGSLVERFDAGIAGLPGRKIVVLIKQQPTRRHFPRGAGEARSRPLT